jgi:hypothetical protein
VENDVTLTAREFHLVKLMQKEQVLFPHGPSATEIGAPTRFDAFSAGWHGILRARLSRRLRLDVEETG